MAETRYSAQAVTDQFDYGEPEIIIFREKYDADNTSWDPHEIVQRGPWPYEELDGGEQVLADADDVLAEMGWRTIPADTINGGWDPADFGAVAVVEPRDD
jgi:hypothetical protein